VGRSVPMSTELKLRPIEPRDDAAVAAIIRMVMPEFGASGPGFAIHDPEVNGMSAAYARPGCAYWVVEDGAGRVVGGGGIAPLDGGGPGVCELKKMYFLPEARGHGMGERLLRQGLAFARAAGYRTCYLETLEGMAQAQKLYGRLGFQRLCAPMGATGHFGCDRWYALELHSDAA
jgi:putative acetyltransferase